MSAHFSIKHLSTLVKFWILVLIVSGAGVWILAPDRDSSAQVGPVTVSGEIPLLFPPRIAEIVPKNNAIDVLLGIEDPIVVRFTESVKTYHIRFELNPEAELLYENNPEKTEFRLLPREPLREGTHYTLTISYISRETPDALYKPLTEMNFTTIVVPVIGLPEIKEQALSETAPYRTEGKYIDVDITHQTMVLFEHGRAVDSYLVSSGKRGMDTPQGEFAVVNKALRPWSKTYGLYMPHWMAFTGDGKYGIHELPEWPGGYKEGANHLGHPVSHGCIRLGVGSAKRVYEWADIGTVIYIH